MLNLDFRAKFIMTMSIASIGISGYAYTKYPVVLLVVYLIPLVLLTSVGQYKKVIRTVIAIAILKLLMILVNSYELSKLSFVVFILSYVLFKLLPGFLMGYYSFVSTSMSDLIQSLNLMHLPDSIKITLSVMFRFFYSVAEDYRNINDAMKMHGLTMMHIFKEPLRIMEYKMVPLLMCSSKCADDVAVSAITRGLRIDQPRSSISTTHLKFIDYVFFLLGISFVALEIWCKLCSK